MSTSVKIILFSFLILIAIVTHLSLPPLQGNSYLLALFGWALIFKGVWDILDIKKDKVDKEKINIKV